jgi:serine/threonine-protein kinase RsbT
MNDRTESAGETVDSGTVRIESEQDILRARQQAREVAEEIGFRITDVTRIVTAVSELARNIHLYADEGEMRWRRIEDGTRTGIELVFDDDGPGIDDVEGVLHGEHSTSQGMGRGIQGTKKLMDDFDLTTGPESGTTIVIRKWSR